MSLADLLSTHLPVAVTKLAGPTNGRLVSLDRAERFIETYSWREAAVRGDSACLTANSHLSSPPPVYIPLGPHASRRPGHGAIDEKAPHVRGFLMSRAGLEPATPGLKVRCSTN